MTSIVLDKQNVTYFPTDTIYSQETQDNHFFLVKHVNQNRMESENYYHPLHDNKGTLY
jgi:hypothetical protein